MRRTALLLILLIYAGIGAGLALMTLSAPRLRQGIDRQASRVGMSIAYGRLVWLYGTFIAWPIGLYVLATGRLVLVDAVARKADANDALPVQTNSRWCVRRDVDTTPRRAQPHRSARETARSKVGDHGIPAGPL